MTDPREPMAADPPDVGTCPTCGNRMFPILSLPPCGHEAAPTIAPLDTPGVVYSWTRVWPSADSSTLMVMADFLDGDLRITAPLAGTDTIVIGDRVRAVIGTDTLVVLVADR